MELKTEDLAKELEMFHWLEKDITVRPYQSQVDRLRKLHKENESLRKQLKTALHILTEKKL